LPCFPITISRPVFNCFWYQQGADMNARNQQRDPDNKLLWQRPARRLEAEAIRDALLSVGEKLDPSSLSALTIAERREDEARGENRARSAVDANISRSPSAESDIPSG
jgi:hypothetical protein